MHPIAGSTNLFGHLVEYLAMVRDQLNTDLIFAPKSDMRAAPILDRRVIRTRWVGFARFALTLRPGPIELKAARRDFRLVHFRDVDWGASADNKVLDRGPWLVDVLCVVVVAVYIHGHVVRLKQRLEFVHLRWKCTTGRLSRRCEQKNDGCTLGSPTHQLLNWPVFCLQFAKTPAEILHQDNKVNANATTHGGCRPRTTDHTG